MDDHCWVCGYKFGDDGRCGHCDYWEEQEYVAAMKKEEHRIDSLLQQKYEAYLDLLTGAEKE